MKANEPDLDKLGPGRAELKNLLSHMLEKDPERRATIYDVMGDAWVTSEGTESVDLDLESDSSLSHSSFSQLY